ncbi:hypothetical protein ACW9HJ_03365 [Nocardia gipuzkoensis]
MIEREQSALHLIHYATNPVKTLAAEATARRLHRWLTIRRLLEMPACDGEIDEIHALVDTQMVLDAAIVAAHYGMRGIAVGFNKDDLGIDTGAVTRIMCRAAPNFEILTPLAGMSARKIRKSLDKNKTHYVTCMVSDPPCGYCPKCVRGY